MTSTKKNRDFALHCQSHRLWCLDELFHADQVIGVVLSESRHLHTPLSCQSSNHHNPVARGMVFGLDAP